MDRIQRSLKQLKDDHMAMKQHYEEEIVRLQRKLDQTHKGESDGRIGVSLTYPVSRPHF